MTNDAGRGFGALVEIDSRPALPPFRHKPGARNFFRSRPALLSTLPPTQLAGVGLALAVVDAVAGAAAVVAAGALAALYRESRG